jgi:hypothetical protein
MKQCTYVRRSDQAGHATDTANYLLAVGVAFEAGAGCTTTPDTDDDHFVTRAVAYFQGSRPLRCGPP